MRPPGETPAFRILVVDDNVPVAEVIAATLRDLGAGPVVTATSVADAVPLLRALRPELVITDVYMPGGSGIEMLAEVQKWSATTPVIAMSGGLEIDAVQDAGFLRVLQKPVSRATLAEVLTALRGA
jgi:CheY-like chemotaxis protein